MNSRIPASLRPWLRPVSALVVFLGILAVYFLWPNPSPTSPAGSVPARAVSGSPVSLDPEVARRIGVSFVTVSTGPLSSVVRGLGQVAIDESRLQVVSASTDGLVQDMFVSSQGSQVFRGQVMLTLYSPSLVGAQEELLLARDMARSVADSVSRVQAADLLASARRRLSSLGVSSDLVARIERTGVALRAFPISATSSGVVVERVVTKGSRVMPGDPLYRIADLSTVWVESDIPERDIALVRLGDPASVSVLAWPGRVWRGRVSYLYPTVSPDTHTQKVRVALSSGGVLKPGMTASVVFAGAIRSVVTVPRSAVLRNGEKSFVFVRSSTGSLVPTPVVLGLQTDASFEVISGIAPGQRVVSSAAFLIDAESSLGAAMASMPGMDMSHSPEHK